MRAQYMDSNVMNDTAAPTRNSRSWLFVALVALLALGLGGWRGWNWWQAREAARQTRLDIAEQRVAALEARIEALRRDLRAQSQRIQDGAATNRVLRDEVLGLGQRGALLEDTVAKLADSRRSGAQALRLDEVELLLSQAGQRLQVADDAEGARRAYALAAGALDGIDDPRLLNLKQALAQERAAADALGVGTQATTARKLAAFRARLRILPARPAETARPAWQRLISPLVEVRPSQQTTLDPAQRTAAQAALDLQLGLAQAALERGDDAGFDRALAAADAWLPRLWPASPALARCRAELKALQAAPLRDAAPVLGSTLQQLRAWRAGGPGSAPSPAATAMSMGDKRS